MGKDAAPAPAPDPLIGQAAANNVELGREQLDFMRQQYADGRIRQADLDALTKQVAESALNSQARSDQWSIEDREVSTRLRDKYEAWADADRKYGQEVAGKTTETADIAEQLGEKYERNYLNEAQRQGKFGAEEVDRYRTTFRPVQDRMVSDAMSWDSAGRLESEAGKAKADVVSSAQQQRDATSRSMMSMGVNPNSGRFAAMSNAVDTMTALGAAGAQNAARDGIRLQAQQLRGNAAQLGNQVLSNGQQANQLSMAATGAAHNARVVGQNTAMQARNLGLAATGVGNTSAGLSVGNQGAGYQGIGTGLQAGNAAVGANQAGTAGWMGNNAMMQGGFSGAINANASGAGIANAAYGNQLNAWGQQQQANAAGMGAIGQMVGTGASLYLL